VLRKVLPTALSFAIVLSVPVFSASPASAQQEPDTLAEVDARLDEEFRRLEPRIEELNGARIELEERREEAEALEEELAPLEEEADVARGQVSEFAAYTFKGGNVSAVQALLTTGSPTSFADRLTLLDQFARSQQETIDGAVEALSVYEEERAELDSAIEELSDREAELEQEADEIEAEIDDLQALRDELIGNQAPPASGGNPGECPSYDPGGAAGVAIRFACAQIGDAYVFGEAGPDQWDCSGLTSVAWAEAGFSFPHQSAQQRDSMPYIERSELQPGDFVFFYSDLSHVGLYAGDGYVVEASNPNRPVGMSPIDQKPVHSYGRPS
jgi:peptidoglycan DL-endopeptidase CwlO